MTVIGWVQIAVFVALLLLITKPLGSYMARVFAGERTFLSPLLGVGFGVWLLGEPLAPEFVWGAALVLAGVIVVNAAPGRQAQ